MYIKSKVVLSLFFLSFLNSAILTAQVQKGPDHKDGEVVCNGEMNEELTPEQAKVLQEWRQVCNKLADDAEKLEALTLNRLDNYVGSFMIASVGLLMFWKLWSISSNLESLAKYYR